MALIICPECGGKVSDKAPACVHCGYPMGSADIKNSKLEEVEVVRESHESIEGFNSLPIFEKKENGIYEVNETNLGNTFETLNNIAKEKGIEVSLREKGSEEMLKLLETIPNINEMDKLLIRYKFWDRRSKLLRVIVGVNVHYKCMFKVLLDRKVIPIEEIVTCNTPLLNLSYVKETDRWVAFGIDVPSMEEYKGVERLNADKTSNEGCDGNSYIVHENANNNTYTDKELEYCDVLEKMIDSIYDCARKAPSNYIFPCFDSETAKQKRTAELQKNESIEGFGSLPIFEKKENGIYEVNETNLDKAFETLSNIAKEKGIEVWLREKGSEEMLKLLETIPDINEMDKLAIRYQFWRKRASSFALQLAKDERKKCLLKVHIDRKTIPLEEIITWKTPLLNLSYIKDTDRWVAFGFGDIPCMEKYEGVERLNFGKPSNEQYDCDPYIVHENAKNNRYTDKELEYCDILEKMIDSVYECARKAPSNYIFPCFNNETLKQKRTAELQKNISDREKVKQDMKSKAAGRNAYNEFIAMHKDNSPKPKCFSCGSTNLKKITFANKAGSAYLFGIFAAGKASKSWHCNDCGTEW